jgi:hypothetical protein
MTIALVLLILALAIGGVAVAAVMKGKRTAIECDRIASYIGGTALQRDQGVLRENAVLAKGGLGGGYSAAQIEAMLDAVYLHGIGKSPDDIKNLARAQCMKKDG